MIHQCSKCGNRYRRLHGYASISWGAGETELDQLRSYKRVEICGHCLLTLKAWLGIHPIPDEPQPVADETLPARPFSAFDERLSYAPPYRD